MQQRNIGHAAVDLRVMNKNLNDLQCKNRDGVYSIVVNHIPGLLLI